MFPEDIQTGRHLVRETDWLGSPGGGCGGVIFQLKAETASKIDVSGLEFLEDKTQARGMARKYAWSLAKKEDVPGIDYMLQCVSNGAYDAKIRDAVKSKSAFLGKANSTDGAILLLLPKERLAFAGYWDP